MVAVISPSVVGEVASKPAGALLILSFLFVFFLGAARYLDHWRSRKLLPLPPGPKPLPIIGNVLDIPTTMMAQRFSEMSRKYGDVVSLNAFGQPMVILGSHAAATELLDKRSANYSDRLPSAMRVLAGWEWTFVLMPYGLPWRRRRKELHQFFHPNTVTQYRVLQERETVKFLGKLLEKPDTFLHQLRHSFASTIMHISYGMKIANENDPYVAAIDESMEGFNAAFVPGAFLVETFPSLRHIPDWFPGASFKRKAAAWKKSAHKMRDAPFEKTVEDWSRGIAEPSITTKLMENAYSKEGADMNEERIIARDVSALSYIAGADTTISTVQTFFMAMACYPEVQKRARKELDMVIGLNRLPTFEDRDSLPYITAIAKESVRWQSVVPLGIPHRSLDDDEYNGYFIPAGSVVIANLWAFSRDEKVYPDPETFNPDRFLKDGRINQDIQDPATFVFGYGRRICPGRHFAEASLFIMIASLLYTMSIEHAVDEDGNPITPEAKMTQGVISYPVPFPCTIKPRSAAHVALIQAGLRE